MIYQNCGCSMTRKSRWHRIYDIVFCGHSKHVCNVLQQSDRPHVGRCRCVCGEWWDPIFTDKNKES